MEYGGWHPTHAGVPQGNSVAPLLANIALHGMESALGIKYNHRGHLCSKRGLVKYADDFVVMCESKQEAEAAIEDLTPWLQERGAGLPRIQLSALLHARSDPNRMEAAH